MKKINFLIVFYSRLRTIHCRLFVIVRTNYIIHCNKIMVILTLLCKVATVSHRARNYNSKVIVFPIHTYLYREIMMVVSPTHSCYMILVTIGIISHYIVNCYKTMAIHVQMIVEIAFIFYSDIYSTLY